MPELRKCNYKGEKYYFHTWFQEGGFDEYPGRGTMEGCIDVGAVLEHVETGKVIKVYDISEEICFEREAM